MQQQQNGAEKVQNGADALRLHFKRMEIIAGGGVYTHTYQWLNAHKITYPKFIFWSAVAGCGLLLATVGIHAVSTGFGRIVEDIILQAGVGVAVILFLALFGKMFIDTWQAGAYVAHTWNDNKPEPEAMVLATGPVWQPPSLGVDTLICLLPGETLASFHEREKAARAATSYAIWAAIIPPFQNAAAIYTAEEETDFIFTRGDEPFLNPEAPDYVDRRAWDHSNETYQAYTQYVDFFAPRFVKFAEQKKLVVKQERASRTFFEINAAKALSVTVCFLLFCLPVFGQSKARQVDETLGTRIREIPEAGERVTFVFREGSKDKYYERTGDGKSEYTDLLQKTSGLVKYNDQGGELVAIMKNGEAVAKAAHVERVNEVPKVQSPVAPNGAVYLPPNNTGDPIRPYGTLQGPDVSNTPVTDEPLNIHIPTPDEVQTTLDNASREIDYRKTEAWAAIKPIWKWIMGMFFSIVPLFICLGGLFRYYAGTAANESFYGLSGIGILIRRVHETASGVTLLICWGIATILLIDEFMLFVYLGIPLWLMLATWFPSLFLAKVLTNWAVPNPPELAHGRGGYDQPYAGQRRIG
jgi:hypothetical protein